MQPKPNPAPAFSLMYSAIKGYYSTLYEFPQTPRRHPNIKSGTMQRQEKESKTKQDNKA
jgi:hypothetical protein